MIEVIKSHFILKKIICHIKVKRKLLLFAYNKRIKKNLNINTIDYIYHSKKYKIAEKNGKGKEYKTSNKKLIFEGEYKNGKRNGIGTSYYYNIESVSFKGNYKDGMRNGKGIEYSVNDNIEFEGEYLNGYRYNGKGYDLNNNIVYELKNGCGYVKIYHDLINRLLFEGEYKDCIRNGNGKEYDIYGEIIFEGEYKNGKKWNRYIHYKQNVYELKEGNGYIKSLEYEGEYKNGKKSGKGKESYIDNTLKFAGEYINGERNGKGKEYDINGNLEYEGEYLNNEKNGKGKEYYSDGKLFFEGEYLCGYRRRGKKYNKRGKIEFEGEYLFYNEWTGKGYDDEGNVIYELNEGNGNMITFYNNGKISFEGNIIKG